MIKTLPALLGGYVKFFYSVIADAAENSSQVHRRLPDGTLDLVCNLGDPVVLSRDEVHYEVMPPVCITGLYPDRSFLQYTGNVHLVGAVFNPGAAPLFVNDSLEHFRGCTYDATAVLGNRSYPLLEQLTVAASEKARHDLLELFLYNCLQQHRNEHLPGIFQAVQHIHTSQGNIALPVLQGAAFMSERNFRRKFTEMVGMSPKKYANIIRVKSFCKNYQVPGHTSISLLRELGYIDQAHFGKDFRKIVGVNATDYFGQLTSMGKSLIYLI